MGRFTDCFLEILQTTADHGAEADRAEARELLRRLDAPAKFARSKKRHVRIKRVRKPRETFAA